MKLLVAHGSGPSASLIDLITPHLAAYAQRHGYELSTSTDPDPARDLGARTPQWAKVALLRQLLPEAETVLWVDSDIVLRDQDRDIAQHFHPEDFQALSMEHGDHGPGPNTGIWLLRNNTEAREFLDAVWERGPLPDATLNDQATVASLLGFSYLPNLTRPVSPSPWLARTGWIHPSWNTLLVMHPEQQSVARGIHYGGLPLAEKRVLIRQQLVSDRLPGWEQLLDPEAVAAIKLTDISHPAPRDDR